LITSYGYDTLGNLISVLQTVRARALFLRFTIAPPDLHEPEVGTITYSYNPMVLSSPDDARELSLFRRMEWFDLQRQHRLRRSASSKAISYSNGDHRFRELRRNELFGLTCARSRHRPA